MSARYIAYKILFDIEVNENYSNMALNKFLNEADLDDQDKGFVTELVYGILERKRYLDYMINKVSKIKVRKMQHSVKLVLLAVPSSIALTVWLKTSAPSSIIMS